MGGAKYITYVHGRYKDITYSFRSITLFLWKGGGRKVYFNAKNEIIYDLLICQFLGKDCTCKFQCKSKQPYLIVTLKPGLPDGLISNQKS
jgi:hypothetical protein